MLLSLLLSAVAAADDPLSRFELDGGVELAVLHLPDARRQGTLTFVDFGLLDDGPGRTQWAHLVEHALIHQRPLTDEQRSLGVNGETRGGDLHLETICAPGRWREALALHASWLTFGGIGEEALEREVGRLLTEVETTEAGGFTGKWALAGAAQVLLHGAGEVLLRGDVRDARPAELTVYVAQRVPLASVRIYTVGPAAPGDVRAALAPLVADREVSAPAPREELRPPAPGDRTVPWDLTVAHHLELYPLEVEDAADRVAAEVLARLVWTRLAQELSPTATASVEEVGPLGPSLVVSLGGVTSPPEELRERLDAVLEPFRAGEGLAFVPMVAAGLRRQYLSVPDLEPLREHFAGRPQADLLEAQVLLNLAGLEVRTGLLRDELADALGKVDAERVAALASGLDPAARRAVRLVPR